MSEAQKREETRFRDHLRRLSVRNFPSNTDGFDNELTELGKIDQRVRSNLDEFYTGSLGSSMAKNRFDDVKPNEQTLVRLRPISKRGDGTYINANYIDPREAMGVPFVYIVTQAPMQNTVLDFWRMVYENDVAFIVMLCAAKENGKVKSETYWPAQGQVYDLGLLSIATLSENVRSDSVHRTLLLRTVRGDEKEIYHMQYLAWPDQGIPTTSIPLMEMIQAIGKSRRSVESPIVVHCSGGVGRTGVFVGMHIALAQFQLECANISIVRIIRLLKLCRSGMVQRKDQYIYLYYSVHREMERMLLSAEKGVNLLDIRPRDRATPVQGRGPGRGGLAIGGTSPSAHARLVGRPMRGVYPLPDAHNTFWSATTLSNLLHSTRLGRHAPAHHGGYAHHHLEQQQQQRQGDVSRLAPPRQHRDVVADMAAMEDYLRHNPSMRVHAQQLQQQALPRPPPPPQRYAAGGCKSIHHTSDSNGSTPRCASPSPRRGGGQKDDKNHSRRTSPSRLFHQPGSLFASTPGRSPVRAEVATTTTAADVKLATELLRIQSLNRQMRFAATEADDNANSTITNGTSNGAHHSRVELRPPSPTPLSITRGTPRTRETTPRVVLTSRRRSSGNSTSPHHNDDDDDDLAYLQRRVATREDWRRL